MYAWSFGLSNSPHSRDKPGANQDRWKEVYPWEPPSSRDSTNLAFSRKQKPVVALTRVDKFYDADRNFCIEAQQKERTHLAKYSIAVA